MSVVHVLHHHPLSLHHGHLCAPSAAARYEAIHYPRHSHLPEIQ
jgi:hypothetical protein